MQKRFYIRFIKIGIAVLSLVAVGLAASIYASKALAMECVNEPDDHLKSWCAAIPGGHHPDAPPKEGETKTSRNDPNWKDEQDSIKERNKNLENTEKYQNLPLTDPATGQGLPVFVNETGTLAPTSDDSHSWEAKQKAGESDTQPVTPEADYEYITFTCDRCGEDRRCETGVGENPRFSFGASGGSCAQVDRRARGSTGGWQAVSLCNSSCSGGGVTITGGGDGGGPPPPPPPPPPAAGVVCGSLGKDVSAPQLNQTVMFTCTGSFSAVDPVYEFRHRTDSGSYTVVPGTPNTSKTVATAQVTINQAGTWEAQCRVCTDASKTSCTTWGQAQ